MKAQPSTSSLPKADILLRFEFIHLLLLFLYILLAGLRFSIGQEAEWFVLFFAFISTVFLFLFIRYYYDPIRSFLREYGGYFSISALYIVLMGFLLMSIDQMDILIVDLFDRSSEQGGRNLAFFALFQFPVSISIVWYMPYYLFFSDNFYAHKHQAGNILPPDAGWWDKVRYYYHILLPIRTLHLHNEKYVQGLPRLESKNRRVFHNTRRFLGAVYILTLTGLITHILNAAGWTAMQFEWALLIGFGVMALFHGPIWYRTVYFVREGSQGYFCRKRLPRENLPISSPTLTAEEAPKRRPFAALWMPLLALLVVTLFALSSIYLETKRENWHHNFNFFNGIVLLVGILFTWGASKLFSFKLKVNRQAPAGRFMPQLDWHALSVLMIFALALTVLAFIIFGRSLVFLNEGHPWDLMISYLVFNYLFLYSFMGMAYYRRFWKRHVFVRKHYLNAIGRALDEFITPVIMLMNFFMAVLFVASFAGGLFHFESIIAHKIHVLNPINIFFIFINGIIALLALIDRVIFLRDQQIILGHRRARKTDTAQPQTRLKVFAFVIAIFVVGFYFIKRGNEYHTLAYIEAPALEVKKQINLPAYTEKFLARRDSSRARPIVMIAADGGGIKAAYWTLKVMKHLEDSLDIYDQDVFLTSGASGGSIGLGMYVYLKAQGLNPSQIDEIIHQLGKRNFLNADFAGLLSRWPLNMVPDLFLSQNPDRMDVMAQNYIDIATVDSAFGLDQLRKQAFSYLWTQNDYRLPLYVTNTARMEDGRKGITHPLAHDPSLTQGLVDLSSNPDKGRRQYLTFPDALFTTNRFPVFSPIAEIEGKGHFFDAGVVDNSGVGTILQFLQFMAGNEEPVFKDFLAHDIILISIRSAKSRYIYENFAQFQDSVTHTQHLLYANAVISVISNDGMTGIPLYFDDLMQDSTMRRAHHISRFCPITLPFKINDASEVLSVLYGEEVGSSTQTEIYQRLKSLNEAIVDRYDPGNKKPIMLEPPLGRMLASPARQYMDAMAAWQTDKAIEAIRKGYP
jgi:hypothetical protein